jgi:hypothetical protein
MEKISRYVYSERMLIERNIDLEIVYDASERHPRASEKDASVSGNAGTLVIHLLHENFFPENR